MSSYTQLKGVNSVGDSLFMDQCEMNLAEFLNWGFLGVGGFSNVTIPTSGYFGGNYHQLRCQHDDYYADGQVWQADRHDWVWETGVAYPTQPIRVSGAYVNGSFVAIASTGVYAHHIDYPRGRVVFDSPIPINATVTCEYSYRLFQVRTADVPWWQELQSNSFRVDDSQFQQFGSGAWAVLSDNRIQMPAVVIEARPEFTSFGMELGDSRQWTMQTVHLHVLTEDRPSFKFLTSALSAQKDLTMLFVDKNAIMDSGVFPIDDRGMPVDSGTQYPDLLNKFGWKRVFVESVQAQGINTRPSRLNYAVIRMTLNADLP